MRWSLKEHLQIDQMAQTAADFAHAFGYSVPEVVDALNMREEMREDVLRCAEKYFAQKDPSNNS